MQIIAILAGLTCLAVGSYGLHLTRDKPLPSWVLIAAITTWVGTLPIFTAVQVSNGAISNIPADRLATVLSISCAFASVATVIVVFLTGPRALSRQRRIDEELKQQRLQLHSEKQKEVEIRHLGTRIGPEPAQTPEEMVVGSIRPLPAEGSNILYD